MAEQAKGSGMLVTTPNPNYTGRTAGVTFVDGRAFIPNDWPEAEFKLRILVDDFGYAAAEMSAEEAARLRLSPDMPVPVKKREDDGALVPPGYKGG